jgi:hypothetical protein
MSRKRQNPVKNVLSKEFQTLNDELNKKIDESIKLLIKCVETVLNDERVLKTLKLNMSVEVLKQSIPTIINNEKEKFLDLFVKCCQSAEKHFPNVTDVNIICGLGAIKFINEIDNITKCVEVKK